MFIQIEGTDGVGKTTQCNLLCKWLNSEGIKATVVKELKSTSLGRRTKNILNRVGKNSTMAEMFLFLASKSQAMTEVIMPALSRGECIIGDRGDGSFLSYNYALGLDKDMLIDLLQTANFGVSPDLTILIDLSPESVLLRLGQKKRQSRFDSISRLQLERQKKRFLVLANTLPNWELVDGLPTADMVHKEIVRIVRNSRGQI